MFGESFADTLAPINRPGIMRVDWRQRINIMRRIATAKPLGGFPDAEISDMPLVVAGDNKTTARRLQRLVKQGQLRRIYAGIYTDDLLQPLEVVVRRELFALCSLIAHGSIISHRSALDGNRPTPAGNVFLTGPNRRDFNLPGVTLRMAQGVGPLDSDIRISTFAGEVFVSSQARALLENLTASRGDPAERRTLGAKGVEAWLDRFISHDIGGGIDKLRETARSIAEPLELQHEFKQLDATIGALLGTRTVRLSARAAAESSSSAACRCPGRSESAGIHRNLLLQLHRGH